MDKITSCQQSLFRPVSASSLGLFRMLFGLILLWQVFYVFNSRFIEQNFLTASYHFPFTLFDILHLPYLPPVFLHILFLILGIAALMIFAGLYFRPAAVVFFLGFLYIVLSEKSIYHDYYYLLLLITFLLIFSDADRWPALHSIQRKKITSQEIPFWQIFIIRMQFVIVYFYAALGKISTDWLIHAQPLKRVLDTKSFLGLSLGADWLAYLFSWGGFMIDMLAAILLLTGRWRYLAFACVLFFNLTNLWLFNDIEAFPVLMIAGIVLFLDPRTPADIVKKTEKIFPRRYAEPLMIQPPPEADKGQKRVIMVYLAVYILIQLLVPLRHFLYPGNASWTFEGSRFAWRLKLNAKKVELKVIVTNPATGQSFEVPYQNLLTPQQTWMDNIPDLLLQYVHTLKKDLQKEGMANPVIRVEGYAQFNDRPRQRYIDGSVNLAEVEYPLFSHAEWIVPLQPACRQAGNR